MSSSLGAGIVRNTLYITNAEANTVTKCDIAPTSGALSNCGVTGTVAVRPYSISFYMDVYAYIANEGSRSVTLCKVSLDGSLVDCVDAGYNKGEQVNYSVVTANYLLLAAFNGGLVYRCSIMPSTGFLTD